MKKTLLILFAVVINSVIPISAKAACTSNTASGSVKVGSAIAGGSVVVCASSSAAKTTTATKTSAKTSTTVKKVAAPIKVVAPPCVIKVSSAAAINDPRVPGCSYQIVAPPKVTTAIPVTTKSSATVATTQNDQAAFTPNPIGISSSANVGGVGQAFFFAAIAATHSRTGTILGQPAQVNFDPVGYQWNSDDGDSGSGTSFSTSWSNEGSRSVSLTVEYSVSYSLGAGWIDAGLISSSASAAVMVSSIPAQVASKPAPPLLVSGNCTIHPSSYRC